MNILTDEEITDLTGAAFDDHAWEGTTAMSVALARSIEAAVIKRLAGVSVEPDYSNPQAGCYFDGYTKQSLDAAIAAARVQENERCAKAIKAAYMEGFFSMATYNDTQVNDENEEWEKSNAKRALLGKEAQS